MLHSVDKRNDEISTARGNVETKTGMGRNELHRNLATPGVSRQRSSHLDMFLGSYLDVERNVFMQMADPSIEKKKKPLGP
jgi:hypothetical protein